MPNLLYLDDAGVAVLKSLIGEPTDEQVTNAVNAALAAHPEWTTTVQDGSITGVKIANDTIPDAKLAQTGGVLSDVAGGTVQVSGATTAGTARNLVSYGTYRKGERYVLSVSATDGVFSNNAVVVFAYKDHTFSKNVSESCEFTLENDATYVSAYIGGTSVVGSGTATLTVAQAGLLDRTTKLESSAKKLDGVTAGSKTFTLTVGTTSTKDIDYGFKAGDRLSLLVSGSDGLVSSGAKSFFLDVTNNAYITPATSYNVPVEYTMPADSSKIRCIVGSNVILSGGSVTFTIEVLSLSERVLEVEGRVTDAERTLAPIDEAFTKFDLPSYYYTDSYIQNKVSQINTLAKTAVGNGDAFVFITDEHWLQNAKVSPSLLRYVYENTDVNMLVSGGDTGNGGSRPFCRLLREAWGGNVHHVVGNHEYDSGGTDSNLYYMMDMHNNDEVGEPQKHYYYFDNVQAKIRYIVLNSDGNNALSADQLSWFTSAMNVESGWGIIIFVHWLYMINWSNDAISLGSNVAQGFVDAINNYSGNGEIIAVFQGHVHRDRITYTQTDGVPVIITTCDKYLPSTTVIDGVSYQDIDVPRTLGTITEQAFDVVIVNRSTKTITAVRIGGLARDGVGNSSGSTVEYRTVTWQ